MKTLTKKWSASIVGIGVLCTLLSGCVATLDKAKRSAAVSQQVYMSVQAETVSQIAAIVEKDKNGTVTQEDRTRLGFLDDLRKVLDKFAGVHNFYLRVHHGGPRLVLFEQIENCADKEGNSRARGITRHGRNTYSHHRYCLRVQDLPLPHVPCAAAGRAGHLRWRLFPH